MLEIARRRKLVDCPATPGVLQQLLIPIGAILRGCNEAVLYASMTDFLGRTVTLDMLIDRFQALYVNLPHLQRGQPLALRRSVLRPSWAPAEVTDLRRDENGNIIVEVKVIWGPFYGLKATRFFSAMTAPPMLDAMAYRLGIRKETSFKRTKSTPIRLIPRPYAGSLREMVRLRLWVRLENQDFGSRPSVIFMQSQVDEQMRIYNRDIIRIRREACFKGLTVDCSKCHLGVKECPGACRPLTLNSGVVNDSGQVTQGREMDEAGRARDLAQSQP